MRLAGRLNRILYLPGNGKSAPSCKSLGNIPLYFEILLYNSSDLKNLTIQRLP